MSFLHNDMTHVVEIIPQIRQGSTHSTSVRTRQNFEARALGDFHDRVSSAARAWGHEFSSEAMHVYMGENRFSLWSYHIDTVFKSIQLSCDICRVSNHHLVHDIHQMVGGLHNLYTNFNDPSHLAFPTSNIGLRTSRHACRLVVANVTFRYPAAPLRILQFLSMCNDNVPLFGGGGASATCTQHLGGSRP